MLAHWALKVSGRLPSCPADSAANGHRVKDIWVKPRDRSGI